MVGPELSTAQGSHLLLDPIHLMPEKLAAFLEIGLDCGPRLGQ